MSWGRVVKKGMMPAFKKLVIAQVVIGILLEMWAYKKLKPLLQKSKLILDAFKKYPEFARIDANKVNLLYLMVVAPFMVLKFVIGWGAMILLLLNFQVISLFQKKGEPLKKGSFLYWWVETTVRWNGRLVMALFGCPWVQQKKVMVDYSKYLGPDWKPSY